MKAFAFLALMVSASFAQAAQVSCTQAATDAVLENFSDYFFDDKGQAVREVEAVHCVSKNNKKGSTYKSCEVGASNGHGAGDLSLTVLLTKDCKNVIAGFITGIE